MPLPSSDQNAEPFVVAFVLGVTPGKWASIWNERMPRHPLELRPSDATAAVAALLDGTVDAAFLRSVQSHESLSSIELYIEQPVVVAPKDHALEALEFATLADLLDENLLDSSDVAADVELVAANVGVAIMPQSVARALSRRDVVARPLGDAATTGVSLVWPTARQSEAVDELIGIVRGRTANSSRADAAPVKLSASQKAAAKKARAVAAGRSGKPGSGAKKRR
ncbi:LysR substrate-binding domain-containing protein [soil metagenome]